MSTTFTLDLNAPVRPYPHYWELCVGSCHAATVLREDVREHIRAAHRDCGFQYLRFHGLFDDDMSVVIEPMMPWGEPEISFYNVDSIFDFLLDTGMKPFVELGFMPEAFASGTQTLFHYKANNTPPKDYDQWGDFIKQFGQHLLDRYGKEEVSQWFFEVWNEPNLKFFFSGTRDEYFKLYETTARALKSVDPCFRVGGPATSVNAWIPPFRAFCAEHDVPLDFISTHHYPSDDPLSTFGMNEGTDDQSAMPSMDELKTLPKEELEERMKGFFQRENKNPRDILFQMTKKAKEEAGDLPLYYTEWNGSKEYDTSYQAAFIAQTLAYNDGLVEGYSFWTVSDIFEEMGMKGTAFKNEFGIQTNHGIPKPSYRMFETLHKAGDCRLPVEGGSRTAEAFALTDGAKATVIIYNHDIERREISPEEVTLTLKGHIIDKVRKAVIDDGHTDPRAAWEAMGSPKYLSKDQVCALKKASELRYETVPVSSPSENTYTFTAEPESVTIFEVYYR